MGNKITTILIIITLGILFYFNFVKEDVAVKESLSVNSATTDILGKKIATALNKLNSLSLDTSIFTEPGYIALRAFHQEILPLPAGKRSPFDPIDRQGFDAAVVGIQDLRDIEITEEGEGEVQIDGEEEENVDVQVEDASLENEL
jgi:hypothetical protein